MFSFLKKMHSEEKLFFYEFIFLSLMVASLPSLEAPKNIFLVSFVSIATIRQLKNIQLQSMHLVMNGVALE